MAKKRQDNPAEEAPAQQTAPKKKPAKKRAASDLPWHPFWRWLISLLVVLHLTAVFCAPWDLATFEALPPGYVPPTDARGRPQPLPPPNSPVWQKPVVTRWLHGFFHDYLNLLYLNHGYEFFAPDPAGTHVIDYQVTQADGKVIAGRLPSHDEQWPRLLYHRHMMLAEQVAILRPGAPLNYANHLATLHNGKSFLQLKIHHLLPPHRVADETPLDAPSTYQTLGEIEGRPRAKRIDTEMPAPTPEAQQ